MKNYTVVITTRANDRIEFTMEANERPTNVEATDKAMSTPSISSKLGGEGLGSFTITVEEQ